MQKTGVGGLVSLVWSLSLAQPTPLMAQCSCEIVVEKVGQLGGDDDEVGLHQFDGTRVLVAGDTSIWLAPTLASHRLARFDLNGRLITLRDFEGQGPGEYTGIRRLVGGRGDSLLVFSTDRIGFHAPDGQFVRGKRLISSISGALVFPDGRIILAGTIPTQRNIGYPLHFLSVDGSPLRSFGEDAGGYEGDPMAYSRSLTRGSEPGTFWSAPRRKYELVLWDTAGARLRTIERDVEWFPEWHGQIEPWLHPPNPRLWRLWNDGEGRLWVLILVADRDFRPLEEEAFFEAMREVDRTYDSIIEVIDEDTGQLIVSRRFDQSFAHHTGQFLIDEDATQLGSQLITLWHVTLRYRTPS